MSKYHYKALTANGDQIEGSLEAIDEKSVVKNLQTQGYYPITATLENSSLKDRLINSITKNETIGFSGKELLSFTQNLSTLLNSGLPLDHALRILVKNHKEKKTANILNTIYDEIKAGNSLSNSLSRFPHIFDSLYIAMIKSGEASGSLGQAFLNLSAHIDKRQKLKSEIVSALTYPALLMVISILSLFFLLTFVIPRFIPMFAGSEQTLPLLSRIVFSLSASFNQYWWLYIIATLFVVFLCNYAFQHMLKRNSINNKLLVLPLFGATIKSHQTANFTRASATLLKNGLNLIDSLNLSVAAVSYETFKHEIKLAITGLKEGRKLSDSLQHSLILSPLTVDLIKIGEESGKLEEMLLKIAENCEQETDINIKRILVFLEPILILGLGVMVALVILSVLLAMLSLNDIII
ncbi:MAG: hypothetical protein COA71_12675 [SAR86 cluster bacterium]|uniref:Type II secretion system protein GspF domain-containing protein n=1 Tax=SAR86 cluster bacterium TaxID=2030880 RepID=A0A2A5C9H6_9GAMM|nr:MAG: hypothetical protein COA71_12675 [SAR86 cluster bacterium]